jgi:thiamine-phosphate pyrophosphorylase
MISPPKKNKYFTPENVDEITNILPVEFFQFRPKYKFLKNRIKYVDNYYSKICRICRKKNIKIIINDDFEIAEKFFFDGIHLGQNDKKCIEAKEKFGKDFIVGITCSGSYKLYEEAKKQMANYVVFGPIFKSMTKKNKTIKINNLINIRKKLKLPFALIGGINHNNLIKLTKLNPDFLAIIGSIWDYKNGPVESAKLFRKILVEN